MRHLDQLTHVSDSLISCFRNSISYRLSHKTLVTLQDLDGSQLQWQTRKAILVHIFHITRGTAEY